MQAPGDDHDEPWQFWSAPDGPQRWRAPAPFEEATVQLQRFLGQVGHLARLGSPEEAFRATRRTLETLAELIDGHERLLLAAELPAELRPSLRRRAAGRPERFDSDELLQRLCVREGIALPASVHHTRAVLEVLAQASSPGALEQLKGQLPVDYHRLFRGSLGKLPPA